MSSLIAALVAGAVLSLGPLSVDCSPCPSGQFRLKNQCVQCHPSCAECSGHELFECSTCGVDEDGQERFLHQGRCRTHCPRGFFPERTAFSCRPCMANCELCTDDSVCAKCQDQYKLQGGRCQPMLCHKGQVRDPDTGECIDCSPGCKTCSKDNPEMCNSCLDGHFLFRHQCRHHCPQGWYEDTGRGVCVSCPSPCSDCRNEGRCLACSSGYFLNGGECVKQCPQRAFSDSNGGRCQLCHNSCQSCHGPRSTDCDLCLGGNPPLHGQCPRVSCPMGRYFDAESGECYSCDAACRTCFGPEALDCSSCFKGYLLDQDSSCVLQCPIGSYANAATQLCENCSPSCESCVDSSDNCISCSSGAFQLFLHQGRCWATCPDGYFESASGTCEACDSSCLTCDEASRCLSCADGHYLEGGECRLNCTVRTYAADDGTCRRCPAHCDVCADDQTCFKCSFLYLMLSGVCKATCPVGFYEDLDEGRCADCHPTCASCSGPLQDECESCSTFSPKLYKGVCYKDCPGATYYHATAKECQECHQTCQSCSGPDPNQCTQCERGLVLDPNTLLCGVTGDTDCPQRTFLHEDHFTCVGCHQHCYSCQGPRHDQCLTCVLPKYLHNGTCVSECPAGTYSTQQDADGAELGLCLPCDHICSSCTGASPRDCITCSPGYLRLLNICVSRCPSGYYKAEDRCEKCASPCASCSGPGAQDCSACLPPLLELQGTKLCVQRCPQRFYELGGLCRPCHISCQTCTDASPQGCVTCDWGSTLRDKVCYPRCEEGQYFSEEGKCERCDSSCRLCSGPTAEQCLTCHQDFGLHVMERRCARCCQADHRNHSECCVCDSRSAVCVESPHAKSGESSSMNMSSRAVKHSSAALPVALLLALALALAVFALLKAHGRKKLCWRHSYERLSGSATVNMPHGVPEPDSGDEVDVVYTSRGGSVYRRYSFIHEHDTDADQETEDDARLS